MEGQSRELGNNGRISGPNYHKREVGVRTTTWTPEEFLHSMVNVYYIHSGRLYCLYPFPYFLMTCQMSQRSFNLSFPQMPIGLRWYEHRCCTQTRCFEAGLQYFPYLSIEKSLGGLRHHKTALVHLMFWYFGTSWIVEFLVRSRFTDGREGNLPGWMLLQDVRSLRCNEIHWFLPGYISRYHYR